MCAALSDMYLNSDSNAQKSVVLKQLLATWCVNCAALVLCTVFASLIIDDIFIVALCNAVVQTYLDYPRRNTGL